jgi:hypothetical protein
MSLWVKVGRAHCDICLPGYPWKQTLFNAVGMSQTCQQQTMHRNKQRSYSITSSARASSVGGTVIPIDERCSGLWLVDPCWFLKW